jgi:hypothetical protein
MATERVFAIPKSIEQKYHGAGWALAAIAGDQLVDIRYLSDVAAEQVNEAIEAADGAHAAFFVRQWIGTPEAGRIVRELQALGEVSIGMCSCFEFIQM